MRTYRNEWKYNCDDSGFVLLSARLQEVLAIDEHTLANSKYSIHSLYFDDYRNSCARDNAYGIEKRYKWRIRYYDGPHRSLHLELKEKRYGRCHKSSCPLTKKQLEAILDKREHELIWTAKQKLLKRFCTEIMTRRFEPKVIIHYERTAYVEPITNIRITFDQNISASNEFDRFVNGDYTKYPLQEKGQHILEVKFDHILPGYIGNIINSHHFKQIAFSKYYLGRKKIEGTL